MKKYTVYMHVTPSKKVYIGMTCKVPEKRWESGSGYSTNPYFKKAIDKYGWNNIEHIILFSGLSKEEAEAKEIELIALNKSTDRNYGYNIQNGGNSIGKHSEETKRKIGNANKGRKPWDYGKHHSKETRQKIRAFHLGTHLSEETKQKISKAHKGRKQDAEAVRKRAESCGKTVLCVEENRLFSSVKEASKFANVTPSSVSGCLCGRSRTSGGYHWEYA